MKRRRKKRKGHYHTGTHLSTKTGAECRYRSGWELAYLQHLDADPSVVTFLYEGVKVPYVSNVRTGKVRHYFPDFLVTRTDGSQQLVEIKPKRRVSQVKVQKKLKAGQAWAEAHGFTFVVLTEVELGVLGLLK